MRRAAALPHDRVNASNVEQVVIRLLVILSATAGASIDRAADGTSVVYHCNFDESSDANYDRWPDGWTRQTGRDYPAYVKIAIAGESPAECSLRIELDGGAGAAYSPAIPVGPRFNYVLRGRVRTSRLEHDAARVTLTFFDAQRKPIGETLSSSEIQDASQWREFRIDVATPDDERIVQAVIGLHLKSHGADADLVGSAEFTDITLARLPRLELRCGAPFHIFRAANDVVIQCAVSGVTAEQSKLKLELLDVDGRPLVTETLAIGGRRIANPMLQENQAQPAPGVSRELPDAFTGSTSWQPAVPDYGFYRVRVALESGGDEALQLADETTLVVMRPIPRTASGPFGWSLTHEHQTATLEQLAMLLPETGVHWLKYPLWRTSASFMPPLEAHSNRASIKSDDWTERFSRFCERLAMEHIEVVAVLDQPPPALRARFPDDGPLPVASVFLDPEMWREAIDPAASTYSLKVHWWQLGADGDASFIGIPKLAETISGIQARIQRYGQQVKVGFAVGWSERTPAAGPERPPWAFLTLADDPSLPVDELQTKLSAGTGAGVQRWFTLEPSGDAALDVETRARLLMRRMLAARIAGVQQIYFGDPFDSQHGLFSAAQLPREMLLPWRTTAAYLADSEYLGSVSLPSGSRNHVFAQGQEAMMIVWNDQPTTETLYLGEHVEQVDLWGRGKTLARDGRRQIVPVGNTPTFLLGLSLPVARWRLAVQFENDRLESVFGRAQTAAYTYRNSFDQAVSGSVELQVPDVWQIDPQTTKVALASGKEQKNEFDVFLDADASSGPQPIRLDFTVEADRTYEFSVYRTMHVGLGDVEIELSSRLNERGSLVVKQRFLNHTEQEVSFNCLLFAPGRRRERIQVLRQGRGEISGTFLLQRGEELVGHTLWLRAEEIDGQRILNYSIVAEK
jgi:hypothetical protein